ncbi:MAG: zf-TFIIB domain-containing protein [Polyangiaceae bacterium]
MDLVCPHCGCTLSAGQAASTTVHGCASCGGVWLDGAASQKLVGAIDPAVISLAEAASRMATMPFPPHEARPRCPVCRGDLQGVRVEAAAVALDTCNLHGTWFDRGELQAVARAFAATRKTEADRAHITAAAAAAAVGRPLPPLGVSYAASEIAADVATGVATGVAVDLGLGLLEVLIDAIFSS